MSIYSRINKSTDWKDILRESKIEDRDILSVGDEVVYRGNVGTIKELSLEFNEEYWRDKDPYKEGFRQPQQIDLSRLKVLYPYILLWVEVAPSQEDPYGGYFVINKRR